jgi:hypothetical protein
MEKLTIQDAFEPYYAGRNRAGAPKGPDLPDQTERSPGKAGAPTNFAAKVGPSKKEPGSTTEH